VDLNGEKRHPVVVAVVVVVFVVVVVVVFVSMQAPSSLGSATDHVSERVLDLDGYQEPHALVVLFPKQLTKQFSACS
jgi:uncharacterized membrane protein YdfJ with MMPL/SSD domain